MRTFPQAIRRTFAILTDTQPAGPTLLKIIFIINSGPGWPPRTTADPSPDPRGTSRGTTLHTGAVMAVTPS
jgi:hypothetical protein